MRVRRGWPGELWRSSRWRRFDGAFQIDGRFDASYGIEVLRNVCLLHARSREKR